jgi:hypothetical protein
MTPLGTGTMVGDWKVMHGKASASARFVPRSRRAANVATVARHVASFAPGRGLPFPATDATSARRLRNVGSASHKNTAGSSTPRTETYSGVLAIYICCVRAFTGRPPAVVRDQRHHAKPIM